MIRGIVESVVQGVIQRITATVWGVAGAIAHRELFQHYGFTSRPKAGAEVIFIKAGNHIIAIASDDRRYRIAVEEGEIALYDDLGQVVHLKRTGIEIKTTTKVTIDAPTVELTGDLTVAGDVSDQKGSMEEMRTVFNAHTQPVSGAVAGVPTQGMT